MFRVGQRVVCVDDDQNDFLSKGEIYTITGFRDVPCSKIPGVYLKETSHRYSGFPFFASRFRPIVEHKTDISIFKAMLNPSKQSEDA